MLFNSLSFIFLFLPISVIGYFSLNRISENVGKYYLVIISLIFYSVGSLMYLPLLLLSILFNYAVSIAIRKVAIESHLNKMPQKSLLVIGITFNASLLVFFKYANFFIANINHATNLNVSFLSIAMPLAISFFTFQQIAYLIDCYKGKIAEHNFLQYAIFVTFFPKLIAGPIARYEEIMPQLRQSRTHGISYGNLVSGLSLFSIGLFKKVVVADGLSPVVAATFDTNVAPTFIEAWCGALSYTFQIYFDFSGYTDMALGLGKIFNIDLPINFNSPYKATSIIDFWRRWHITLSLFFRDYLYFPLGGSRKGELRQYFNVLLTMCICGLWHGASWTFVFWGMLHGVMSSVNHFWRYISEKINISSMPGWLGWLITFPCVVIAWIFFRADTFSRAWVICKGCFGFNGFVIPLNYLPIVSLQNIATKLGFVVTYVPNWLVSSKEMILLLILLLSCLFFQNSSQITLTSLNKNPFLFSVLFSFIMIVSILSMTKASEFLYFQF